MIDPQGHSIAIAGRTHNRTAGYMPVFGEKKAPSVRAAPGASPETFRALLDGAENGRQAHMQRTASAKAASTAGAGKPDAEKPGAAKEGGFLSFLKTVIDVINPLQHIPVISTLYRHLTGDEISPAARIAGDTLYGGPIGTVVALADVATQETTGRDIGGNVMAMVTGGGKKQPPAPVQMAAAYAGIEPAAGNDITWTTPAPELAVEDVTHLVRGDAVSRSSRGDAAAQISSSEFSPPLTPTTRQNMGERTDADRKGPAAYSYKSPVSSHKTVSAQPPLLAASPALISMQETLAVADRKPAPSGLLAAGADGADTAVMPQRMMEALDKYAAMKKSATF